MRPTSGCRRLPRVRRGPAHGGRGSTRRPARRRHRPDPLEVTDRATLDAAGDLIRDEGGSLNGVVSNAGIGVRGPIGIIEMEEWRRRFDVNVLELVAVTGATFPLVAAANGRFVHIGSIAGWVAAPGLGPYAATKHAVAAINWSLRAEPARVGRMNSASNPVRSSRPSGTRGEHGCPPSPSSSSGSTAPTVRLAARDDDRVHRRGREKAIEPDRVAEAVERALTAKRPKARYLVGTDAKIQSAVSRLPDRARAAVLSKAHDISIENGRKLRLG